MHLFHSNAARWRHRFAKTVTPEGTNAMLPSAFTQAFSHRLPPATLGYKRRIYRQIRLRSYGSLTRLTSATFIKQERRLNNPSKNTFVRHTRSCLINPFTRQKCLKTKFKTNPTFHFVKYVKKIVPSESTAHEFSFDWSRLSSTDSKVRITLMSP